MNKLNILIVEDESIVALELSRTIKNKQGHNVYLANNQKKVMEVIKKGQIDLILMDINLGQGINGIELYKSLKINIPIIFITAYQDENTISKAVHTEPLGYLIKPYRESELIALLKIVNLQIQKQKIKTQNISLINLGEDYFFNSYQEKLFFKESYIKLSKNELLLLRLLIQLKGHILSFKTIEDEIWKDSIPSPSSLRTLIYRLRKKLNHKLITTEFDQGIKLELVS